MPTAEAADLKAVCDELGVTYQDFNFPDHLAYLEFIEERWNRVDRLINDRIGAENHDEVAFPEQYDGHVYWTASEVLRRKRIQLLVSNDGGEGGFTIGAYKVESSAPSAREHLALANNYRTAADEIFDAFIPVLAYKRIGGAVFVPGSSRYAPWASRPDKG